MPSVATQVSQAVADAITALALGPPVKRRKAPVLPTGQQPPQVIVSVGDEGAVERLTKDRVLVKYPVAVTLVTAGGFQLADDDTARTRREAIRQKLFDWSVYAAVPGFNAAEWTLDVPFDRAALDVGYNYSIETVTVEVIEGRAA